MAIRGQEIDQGMTTTVHPLTEYRLARDVRLTLKHYARGLTCLGSDSADHETFPDKQKGTAPLDLLHPT